VAGKLRVSFIEFLNAIPLGWGFLHGAHKGAFEVLFDVPSECARHLAEEKAEVGLIPVIEYQRIPNLRIIPDISIASRRKVKSVLFASQVPIEHVTSVALDSSSRTSAVLLKILLSEFYGRKSVIYTEHPPEPQKMLNHCESALLIGHHAIKASLNGLFVYDLAHEWHRFTSLPFVFAFWAVRDSVDVSHQRDIFHLSKKEGILKTEAISRLYSPKLALSPEEIQAYLEQNLDYSLDEMNQAGLDRFFQLASKVGAIETVRPLQFIDD
jgi:chorismate dehydratase